MVRRGGPAIRIIATLLIVAGLAGCGGSSGSSSSGSSAADPSAQFPTSKADAKFVKFGSEGAVSERKAANAVLEANFKARAAADFEGQCTTLNRKTIKEVSDSSSKDPASACAKGLSKLAQPLSGTKKVRADTLGEPIAALRVKGARAWALFHGSNGKDYAMLMEKEGGIWKVGALVATEL
jgi:hypothetical protein